MTRNKTDVRKENERHRSQAYFRCSHHFSLLVKFGASLFAGILILIAVIGCHCVRHEIEPEVSFLECTLDASIWGRLTSMVNVLSGANEILTRSAWLSIHATLPRVNKELLGG